MQKYELIKPENKEKLFTVSIVADSNDGDYITTTETYTESEFNEIVDELILLSKCYGDKYQLKDFYNINYNVDMPYGEDGQCHTLSSIQIYCINENRMYYDVKLNLDSVDCNKLNKGDN